MTRTLLWRRLDRPGHDAVTLEHGNPNWHIQGTVIVGEAGCPCRLEYAVVCDGAWRTLWARVTGWIGTNPVNYRASRDPGNQWRLNGIAQPQVSGCADIDLAFTPATNLLPIRRLDLPVGGTAPVRAAWLKFPEFVMEPLEQRYTRESDRRYRYESATGFSAALDVDDAGMVLSYGHIWIAEPA
jgi:uncharacterized protein